MNVKRKSEIVFKIGSRDVDITTIECYAIVDYGFQDEMIWIKYASNKEDYDAKHISMIMMKKESLVYFEDKFVQE